MDEFVQKLDTTAMVIGYPVLALIIVLIGWVGTRVFRDIAKIYNEMRYETWKRNREKKYWDYEHFSSTFELDEDYEDLVQRHPTIELPDIQRQLSNYQENRYERP